MKISEVTELWQDIKISETLHISNDIKFWNAFTKE